MSRFVNTPRPDRTPIVTMSVSQSQAEEQALARLADTEYLVRRSATKGYQLFSILAPPLYASFSIFWKGRGHLTVNRLLRTTWLGGAAGRLYKLSSVHVMSLTYSFRYRQRRGF
jgi:hypothetical protein